MHESTKFHHVFTEAQQWGKLMQCETVADLNEKTASGEIRELIRVSEALHERQFSQMCTWSKSSYAGRPQFLR